MSKFPSLEELDNELVGVSEAGVSTGLADDLLEDDVAPVSDTNDNDDMEPRAFPSVEQVERSASLNVSANGTPGPESLAFNLDDSEPIKEWRARQELEIKRRDELSDTKREEIRDKAKKAIDDFYENYNNKKETSIEEVRNAAKDFIGELNNAVSGGTTWDRVLKLIDTSDKSVTAGGRDKTRFKELLLSLKGDPDAPGAAGY
jgi:hypothetical protein